MESSSGGSSDYSNSRIVVANEKKPMQGIKIENPFTFKVLQVFTGFGFGCGIGIGQGVPINMGALPMVGQVMSATRGATDAFSGVTRHVNTALWKLGAKNIQAGVGCGVGFRPWSWNWSCSETWGSAEDASLSSRSIDEDDDKTWNSTKFTNWSRCSPNVFAKWPELGLYEYGNAGSHSSHESSTSKGSQLDTSFGSRTEKVISSFLQNPMLKEDGSGINESDGRLRSENNMLQMVLRHQQIIEELMEENQKLRQILVEDLKIPPNKLQASHSTINKSPCTDCFECRRRQRKKFKMLF
ncbi:DYNAMIN [Salix purpurea]|uniref:DYNAMIN n=1 Tax=Salix purpurea TaxID=77065 RepID=A0A9Q0QGW1_SALPP|nr:DYNAMIN [Salix purpurea]